MEENDIDYEMKVYKIYDQLTKENLFDDWKEFSGKVVKYLEKEWGNTDPPSMEEITKVTESFVQNENSLDKIEEVLNTEDFGLLITVLIIGIDVMINGEKV